MILAEFCPCPTMMTIVVTYNRNIVNWPQLLHKGDKLVNISIGDLWSTALVDNTCTCIWFNKGYNEGKDV